MVNARTLGTAVMYTAEDCLRFAERCESAARRLSAPKQREAMLTIAGIWRDRAKEQEEAERQPNRAA